MLFLLYAFAKSKGIYCIRYVFSYFLYASDEVRSIYCNRNDFFFLFGAEFLAKTAIDARTLAIVYKTIGALSENKAISALKALPEVTEVTS